MAQKFKGNRPLAVIKRDVLKLGGQWNQEKYDNEGSDYVSFTLPDFHGATVPVLFNTFNGRFIIPQDNGEYITEESTEFDGVTWYDELLNLIYEPMKKGAKT